MKRMTKFLWSDKHDRLYIFAEKKTSGKTPNDWTIELRNRRDVKTWSLHSAYRVFVFFRRESLMLKKRVFTQSIRYIFAIRSQCCLIWFFCYSDRLVCMMYFQRFVFTLITFLRFFVSMNDSCDLWMVRRRDCISLSLRFILQNFPLSYLY